MMEQWQTPRRPVATGLLGRTVRTRAMQQIVDVETDASVGPELRESARERGWRSAIQVPMLRGDDVVGVIAVTRVEAGAFAPAEIALLQTFADQAVIAVENARLLDRAAGADGRADALRRPAHRARRGGAGRSAPRSIWRRCWRPSSPAPCEISGLDGGVVFEYDEGAEEFVQRAATEQGARSPRPGAPRGSGRGKACWGARRSRSSRSRWRTSPSRAPTRAGCART